MAGARSSAPPQGEGSQSGGSLLALFIYCGVLVLLVLVFVVIGFMAVSAPVPPRVGFFPSL